MHRNSSNRIFPVAINYPSFFLQNLLDPSRVIKHISGNNCAIRAFYYQFLKLMF